jgi:branched-subunit amino acid aminotransferase/4-amino-4-deoxychorismate lyase
VGLINSATLLDFKIPYTAEEINAACRETVLQNNIVDGHLGLAMAVLLRPGNVIGGHPLENLQMAPPRSPHRTRAFQGGRLDYVRPTTGEWRARSCQLFAAIFSHGPSGGGKVSSGRNLMIPAKNC